jgi:hypothetical protein
VYLGAQHLYPENVEGLAANVLGAHIDDAFHAELCADSRGGHTMLSGTSFSDDPGLP